MNKKKFDEFIDIKQHELNSVGETDFYSFVETVRKNRESVPKKISLKGEYTIIDLKEIINSMQLVDKMRGLL